MTVRQKKGGRDERSPFFFWRNDQPDRSLLLLRTRGLLSLRSRLNLVGSRLRFVCGLFFFALEDLAHFALAPAIRFHDFAVSLEVRKSREILEEDIAMHVLSAEGKRVVHFGRDAFDFGVHHSDRR